jgi:hypothetical protein
VKADDEGHSFANDDLIVALDSNDYQQTVVSDGVVSVSLGYLLCTKKQCLYRLD